MVGGILILDEMQRQNDVLHYEQELKNKDLAKKNEQLAKRLEAETSKLASENNAVKKQNSQMESDIDDLQDDVELLKAINANLQQQIAQYKLLLGKPMAEIAHFDANFKQMYEKQMAVLGEWIVSQKAFKELAIQLGKGIGMSLQDVTNRGNQLKLDVLCDKHDPAHGTNANDVDVVANRIDVLREIITAKLAR